MREGAKSSEKMRLQQNLVIIRKTALAVEQQQDMTKDWVTRFSIYWARLPSAVGVMLEEEGA